MVSGRFCLELVLHGSKGIQQDGVLDPGVHEGRVQPDVLEALGDAQAVAADKDTQS